MSRLAPKTWEKFTADPTEETFEPLHRETKTLVYTICLRILRNPEDAADAFQATYCRLLALAQSANPNAEPQEITTLVSRLAVREANNHRMRRHRRARRETTMENIPPPADTGDSPARAAENSEIRSKLETLVGLLPEKNRVPLLLHYFDGLTIPEIAHALGKPEGTIQSHLARGLKRLRPLARRAGLQNTTTLFAAILAGAHLLAPPAPLAAPAAIFAQAKTLLAASATLSASASAGTATTLTASTSAAAAATLSKTIIGGIAMKAKLTLLGALIALGAAALIAPKAIEYFQGSLEKEKIAKQSPEPTAPHPPPLAPPTLQVRVLWADNRVAAHGTSVTLTYANNPTTPTEGPRTAKATVLTDYSGIATFQIPELSRTGKALIETARAHALPSTATLSLPQTNLHDVFIAKTYGIYGTVYRIGKRNPRVPVGGAEISAVGVEGVLAKTNMSGEFSIVLTSPTVQLLATAGTLSSSDDPARAPTLRLVHEIENGPNIMILGGKGDLLITVLDKATYDPVEGAWVEVGMNDISHISHSYEIDAAGTCVVVGLSAKSVTVKAGAPKYASAIASVNLKAEQANTAIFELSPAGKIHVQTVDKEKRPVGGVPVKLVSMGESGSNYFKLDAIYTDEKGVGFFGGVPIGPLLFIQTISDAEEANKTGKRYLSQRVPAFFNVDEPSERVILEVITAGVENINPVGKVNLRGRVTDKKTNLPVPGLKVTIETEATSFLSYPPTTTNIYGEFQFSKLSDYLRQTQISFLVSGKGYMPLLGNLLGNVDPRYYQEVNSFEHLDPNIMIELQIQRSESLRGRVVDAVTSAPLSLFSVTSTLNEYPRKTYASTIFSSDGTFTLDNVNLKTGMTIEVGSAGYSPVLKFPKWKPKKKTTGNKTEEIEEVGEPKEYKELLFALEPASQVKGIVVDEATGDPVSGAVVALASKYGFQVLNQVFKGKVRDIHKSEQVYKWFRNYIKTGKKGEFTFDAYRKKTIIVVKADGYQRQQFAVDMEDESSLEDDRIVLRMKKFAPLRIVCPDYFTSNIDPDKPETLSVEAREIPEDTGIEKEPKRSKSYKNYNIEDGNIIVFEALPAGKYLIRLRHVDSSYGYTVNVELHAEIGKNEATEIVLPDMSASLSGRVTYDGKPARCEIKLRYLENNAPGHNLDGFSYSCDIRSVNAGNYKGPPLPPGDYETSILYMSPSTEAQLQEVISVHSNHSSTKEEKKNAYRMMEELLNNRPRDNRPAMSILGNTKLDFELR